MAAALIVAALLVLATILIHYEVLRTTQAHLQELPVPPRLRIVAVVVAAFFGHTLEVWLYSLVYWLLGEYTSFGDIKAIATPGEDIGFPGYLYFSSTTYTSLGFGDLVPTGGMRFLAGIEGLNGLILIAWSASFTYLTMEKYWPLHEMKKKHPHGANRRERSTES